MISDIKSKYVHKVKYLTDGGQVAHTETHPADGPDPKKAAEQFRGVRFLKGCTFDWSMDMVMTLMVTEPIHHITAKVKVEP